MYYLDLSKLTLEAYKALLKNNYLIPSMMLLREGIDERFEKIVSIGIETTQDLNEALKNKKKLESFVNKSGLDEKYSATLKRAVSSLKPPVRKLNDYPTIDEAIKAKMSLIGLKSSKDLYDAIEAKTLESVAGDLEIDSTQMSYLKSLVVVTRLRYVSPLYATALVEAGYDSIKKISEAEKSVLCEQVEEANQRLSLYKAKLGENDSLFLINDAKLFVELNG